FEEELRPIRLIDALVDVLLRRLLHPSLTAAEVGDARAPDFLSLGWSEQSRKGGVELRPILCIQTTPDLCSRQRQELVQAPRREAAEPPSTPQPEEAPVTGLHPDQRGGGWEVADRDHGARSMYTVFHWVKKSRATLPCSRLPLELCFMPPKGAWN